MLQVSAKYINFQKATDANLMQGLVQQGLQKLWGTEVILSKFQITRVFPRGEGAFTIQYYMIVSKEGNDSPEALILSGHLLGISEKWPNYIAENKGKVIQFEKLRLVIPVFPFDPKLPAIAELCNLVEVSHVIQKSVESVSKGYHRPEVVGYEVLGYRLERRCVIRFTLGEADSNGEDLGLVNDIIVKIVRPNKLERTIRPILLLEKEGFGNEAVDGLCIPTIHYVSTEKGTYTMEAVLGDSLHNLTGRENFKVACGKAAELLLKLQKITPKGLNEYSKSKELEELKSKVELIVDMYPDLASDLRPAYQAIESHSDHLFDDSPLTCIHRDYYDKQVLYTNKLTTLLDCDSLSLGDPAQDCGNFIAHLKLRQLQEPENASNIEIGIETFQTVYGYKDEPFQARLKWWQSATLLRLAVLYALRPKWQKLTNKLIRMSLTNLTDYKNYLEVVDEKSLGKETEHS